jgi:hypothetical protein
MLPVVLDGSFATFAIAFSPGERTLCAVDSSELWAFDIETEAATILAQRPPLRGWGAGLAVYDPPVPGDLNCDKLVSFFDIDPFLLALFDPPAYEAQFSFCRHDLADLNADGSVNFLDIDGFIAALFTAP